MMFYFKKKPIKKKTERWSQISRLPFDNFCSSSLVHIAFALGKISSLTFFHLFSTQSIRVSDPGPRTPSPLCQILN